jgi:response regulator RpfG family c-di-GMP phosphodiesterase
LLARFDDTNDNADVSLQLVRILLAQREKRCFGHDKLTQAIVDHVHRLARVMGFPPDQERNLTYGCLLRDIGLIDKDDDLMKPPEEMDPTQWPVFRRHPADGAKLLEGLNLPQTIVDVVQCHHERFNGEGFPHGLEGRDIPLAARVVTVVENYVSMVTGTSSHDPIAPTTAARILRDNLGHRYDPDIVGLFLNAILGESDAYEGKTARQRTAKNRVLQRT